MENHLTPYDWSAILNPRNIEQLLGVAIRVTHRTGKMELPVGPLSTGGTRSYAKNIARIRFVVARLRESGRIVFDPSLFDESLRDLARREASGVNEQSKYVMREFYVPLIGSGRISSLVCLPDIDGSVGAQIACDAACSLAPPLPIRKLKESFFP